MRAAPAVNYPLAHGGFWCAAVGLAAALACLAAAAWAAARLEAGTLSAAMSCLACAVTGGVLGSAWSAPPQAQLTWNGERWHLSLPQEAAVPGEPEIALDWGDWMLVRWHTGTGGGRQWAPRCLPLSRRDHPHRWHSLRVALHAGAPRGAAP